MAHRGPAQSARKLGRTPNAEWTEVPNIPYEGPSPDLPPLRRRARYHEMVSQWWDMVRHMPHCVNWTPTDWQYAVETALMKHYFWTAFDGGDMTITAATEIRRREDNQGTTDEARRKLRIRYFEVDPEEFEDDGPVEDGQPPEVVHQRRAGAARPVTSLSSRRARAVREQQADVDADTA